MKCTLKLLALMLIFTSIGGCTVKQKAHTKQAQTATSSSTKEDREVIKQKQLAYLKEHGQEIVDFVKAQNPKVESVQIDWDETQMSDGGLTTPEYYMNVFGRINYIENSGWGVDIPMNEDGTVNLKNMTMGDYISIDGEPID
ncbi:hypothetical protein DW052_06620 [Streptococcus parasanguinis]|nr:hypothetical protein DW052_06620 [Streptococcus parasanguinis]